MRKCAVKVSIRSSLNGETETNRARRKYRVGTKGRSRTLPQRNKVNLGVNSPEPKPPKKEIEK